MTKWIYESEAMENTNCPVPNFNNEQSAFGTSKCMGSKCGAWAWHKDNLEGYDSPEPIITHEDGCGYVANHYKTVTVKHWFGKDTTKKEYVHDTYCSCEWNYEYDPEYHPQIKMDEQGMCGLKLVGNNAKR